MMQMKKKALKFWRDPKGFVADAPPVRRIFSALYGDQFSQMARSVNGPVAPVSSLEPCVLFDGAVLASSRSLATEIQLILEAVSSRIPVILFSNSVPNTAHIGVNRNKFHLLYQIVVNNRPVIWELEPAHRDPINPPNLSQIANANRITALIEVMRGVFARFVISLYAPQLDGSSKVFLTPDSSNRMARKISKELGESLLGATGLKIYDRAVGSPPIQHCRFPVDVVYTWVNHEDPDWQASYRQYAPAAKRVSDAHALSRFKSRDELKYSIRSVFQYMPWVRRIHVLTNCSPPAWLSQGSTVNWVQHHDVIDRMYLPTFSSHAIETSLHHIPGLADNFLYFNDDFFVNRPAAPDLFFEISGLSKSKLEPYGVVNGAFTAGDPDYLNAARLGAELLAARYGVWPSQLHEHSPYALRVSVLKEMEDLYQEYFRKTRENRFRARGDISAVSFLYHHYAAITGSAVPATYSTRLVKSGSGNLSQTLAALNERTGPVTFCLNDGNDSHEDGVWDFEIRRFLEERFPHPSPCEIVAKKD